MLVQCPSRDYTYIFMVISRLNPTEMQWKDSAQVARQIKITVIAEYSCRKIYFIVMSEEHSIT